MNRKFILKTGLLSLCTLSTFLTPSMAQIDEALWDKIDINDDDCLDGIEMKGWEKYNSNHNNVITKTEWMIGRSLEKTPGNGLIPQKLLVAKAVYPRTTRVNSIPKPAVPRKAPVKLALAPITRPIASPKIIRLAPVAKRAGSIVGRAMKTNGAPIPSFTVHYSGFEDGKLAAMYGGQIYETLDKTAKGAGGKYAVKVPPGAYRATAYTTYSYKGRLYNFEMELAPPQPKYDFQSSQLEKLRKGLVRNFVLKMTEKKAGASEETETVYRYAYYGGTIDLDCSQQEGKFGTGKPLSTPLRDAYPADSRILLTLTPTGPMVDGSTGKTINANLRLGDDGKWTFLVRGIFPGVYRATAQLKLPDGSTKPLRLATKGQQTNFPPGTPGEVVFSRYPAVTIDFLPNDLGPVPCMGVKVVDLYLGD